MIDSVSGLWWLTSLTLPQTLFLSLFTTRFLLLPLFIPLASFPHLQLHAPTPGCLFSFPRPLSFISVRFTETCRIRLHIFIAPSRFAQLFRLKLRFNWWRWTQTFSPTSLFLRIVLQSGMKHDTGWKKMNTKQLAFLQCSLKCQLLFSTLWMWCVGECDENWCLKRQNSVFKERKDRVGGGS